MSRLPAPVVRARAGFVARFGRAPTRIAYAPGRVNLMGDHTDYNDGLVLPCAIGCGTAVAMGPADDGCITALALDHGAASDQFAPAPPPPPLASGHWANHVRGVWAALTGDQRATLSGLALAISGDVPQGAGLSSSAALGVALATGFAALLDRPMTAAQRALAAQRSEHDHVGTNCGIMDQLVSAAASAGTASLIDCRSMAVTPAPIAPNIAIIIAHSGVVRELAASAYNQRRRECAAAAAHFGAASLRDVTPDQLAAAQPALDPQLFARARHVIGENARVTAAVPALASGDLATLGGLMRASHAALRDDFAVSTPQVDALVEAINAMIGAHGGARMTGGGFGGCVAVLCDAARADDIAARIASEYQRPDGQPPLVLRVTPAAGARLYPGE